MHFFWSITVSFIVSVHFITFVATTYDMEC